MSGSSGIARGDDELPLDTRGDVELLLVVEVAVERGDDDAGAVVKPMADT